MKKNLISIFVFEFYWISFVYSVKIITNQRSFIKHIRYEMVWDVFCVQDFVTMFVLHVEHAAMMPIHYDIVKNVQF